MKIQIMVQTVFVGIVLFGMLRLLMYWRLFSGAKSMLGKEKFNQICKSRIDIEIPLIKIIFCYN